MKAKNIEPMIQELEEHHLEMSRIMGNISASIGKTSEISYLAQEGMNALNIKFKDHSEKAFNIMHRLKMVVIDEQRSE